MFRRFLADTRGNYMILTAALIVPLMAAVALAVDYSELSRQRQGTLNALDAANFAVSRRFIEGASTNEEIAEYAKQYFEANLGSVDPKNAKLTVQFPTTSVGGGTIKLSAQLKYKPYFAPATNVEFSAASVVQLKNTLEVALVLDNSGSMDFTGAGSGKKRIALLKEAAAQLVDALASQGQLIKQVDKSVQFALVPFAASVNVGPQNATASWMDTDGRSPIHHQNFDWTSMSAAVNSNKYVQNIGGIWYKKGSLWGAEQNQKITRFTMYDDVKRIVSQTPDKTEWKCEWVGYWKCGPVTTPGTTTYAPYASWAGCVETRPSPFDKDDTAPTSSNPATLFVPMFAPDEVGNVWTDQGDSNKTIKTFNSHNSWWDDLTPSTSTATSDQLKRQKSMVKYFTAAPQGKKSAAAQYDEGPNASCTTKPITPLTDVTKQAGLDKIKAAINAMVPDGATNVPEGIAWGWRAVSGGAPFTEGRPDHEKGNDKVVIVLTDGENTYYTPPSLGKADNAGLKSIYSAYGYAGETQPGGTTTRLYMNTSGAISKSTYTNDNYSKAMNEQMAAICANAKKAGVIVMTVALDLSTTDTQQKAQIEGLKECSSESRFRKDESGKSTKLFWNSKGGDLSKTFKEIADELSNLRLVG
jgi:Flp pilus assembly protein TadG